VVIRKQIVPEETETERLDRERRKTIFDLVSALSSTLITRGFWRCPGPERQHTDAIQGAGDLLRSAVLLFTENEKKEPVLQVAVARVPALGHASHRTRRTRMLGAPSMRPVQPVRGGQQRPELSRFVCLHDCHSAYCIPLRSGLDSYGLLFFAHPRRISSHWIAPRPWISSGTRR